MKGRLPALLTVEEAAGVLRIGRTKAYAMAQEWRDTGGKSGLPVVDLGHVLRVPLSQLEAIVGGPLLADDDAPTSTVARRRGVRPSSRRLNASAEPPTTPTPGTAPTASPKPRRRSQRRPDDQLDLFSPKTPAS